MMNIKKILNILKSPIIYILLFCIFVQCQLYKVIPEYTMCPDSYSYYEVYNGNILKGEVDALRTPVYPYCIKIISKVFGEENVYVNVVSFQKIIFLITIVLVYLILIKITNNKIISTVITIIIGTVPYLVFWNTLILTEPLSIFEIALLIYLTVLYLKKPRKSTAISIGIVSFIMIMTRPAFIYIPIIYLGFWIVKYFFNKKEWKEILSGFISTFICILLMLGYCGLMKCRYNQFNLSSVGYINDLVSVIESKAYLEGNNEEIKKLIYDIVGENGGGSLSWSASSAVQNNFDVKQVKSFSNSAKTSKRYLRYVYNKTIGTGQLSIGNLGYTPVKEQYSKNVNYTDISNIMMPINFAVVYILIIASIGYLIYDLIKNAKVDWILAVLIILIMANLVTIIVGAPFEVQRLFISSIIPIVLCIGYILSKIKNKNEKIEIDEENNLFYKIFLKKTDNTKMQFFRYIFVGGIAAVVNIGSLYILKEFLHMYYLLANVLGFILGLITNYLLSKKLVFSEDFMNSAVEFFSYGLIGIVGLAIDTLFMWIFTEKVCLYFIASKIISTCIVFIWNFFGRKGLYFIYDKIKKIKSTV